MAKSKSRSRKARGGGLNYKTGLKANGIENFSPIHIEGLVLWIKADPQFIVYDNKKVITDPLLKEIIPHIGDTIIEIKSDTPKFPNSLVRFQFDNPTQFPEFVTKDGLDVFDITNVKLISKSPLQIGNSEFSNYTISQGIGIEYIPTTDEITVKGTGTGPQTFSEIILYNRILKTEEHQKIEGYLAYKKNQQADLPVTSPYIPEFYTDDAKDLFLKVKDLHASINKNMASISDDALTENATKMLSTLSSLLRVLSKASLLSKQNGQSVNSIMDTNKWFDAPIEHNTGTIIANASIIEMNINKYRYETTMTRLQSNKKPLLVGGATETTTIPVKKQPSAQTEDYEKILIQEQIAVKFYAPLRETSKRMNVAGTSALNTLYTDFTDSFNTLLEVFQHKFSALNDADDALTKSFEAMETLIKSNDWLKNLTFLDSGLSADGTYRDPNLKRLYSNYTNTRDQLKSGDYAYSKALLTNTNKLFLNFKERINSKKIIPILKPFFVGFFKQQIKESQDIFDTIADITKTLQGQLDTIKKFLDAAKETGQALKQSGEILQSIFVYPSNIHNTYIRRVNAFDSMFTGIEYVVTDPSGVLLGANGSIHPFYPVGLEQADNQFKVTFPFQDLSGNPVVQLYKIVEPFKNTENIFDSIPTEQKPQLYKKTIDTSIEVSRLEANGIHLFNSTSAQTILLPESGIAVGAYFALYNTSTVAMRIDIPSPTGNTFDCLGPNEGILYSYLGPSEEVGSNYARFPLVENYLPYDTLNRVPRTSMSAYVKELNATIYVRMKDGITAICDLNGSYVPVTFHKDGNVYDIDDVFKTNPFKVDSVGEKTIQDLTFPQDHKKQMPTQAVYSVQKDPVAGLALLCSSDGQIAINPFGYCKVAQTPLVYINNKILLRGSYDDIVLTIQTNPSQVNPYLYEPFLKFELLFRSRFINPYKETHCFVTNSMKPIVSPDNTFIEPSNLKVLAHSIANIYTEPGGDIIQVFLLHPAPIDSTLEIKEYPLQDLQTLHTKKVAQQCAARLNIHYKSIKGYIDMSILTLTKNKSMIKKTFGNTLKAIDDVVADLSNAAIDLQGYQGTVTSLNEPSNSDSAHLKIAVDVLELKCRKLVNTCFTNITTVNATMELYLEAIEQINRVAKLMDDLQSEGSGIDQNIQSIQDESTREAKNRGSTSSPEIDELLKKAIDYKLKFENQLKETSNLVSKLPPNVSEINSWYKNCKQAIDLTQSFANSVGHLQKFELPHQIQHFNKESLAKEWADFISWKIATQTIIVGLQAKVSADNYTNMNTKLAAIDSAIPSDGSRPGDMTKLLQQQTELNNIVKGFS